MYVFMPTHVYDMFAVFSRVLVGADVLIRTA